MFRYAAARLAAERLACPLLIEESYFSAQNFLRWKSNYPLFGLFPHLSHGHLGVAASLFRRAVPGSTGKWIDKLAPTKFTPRNFQHGTLESNEAFDPLYFDIKPGTRLTGFFQSAKYFAGEEDSVRSWYSIDCALANQATAVFRNAGVDPLSTVAVHVRLGDYRKTESIVGHPWLLPKDYYRRALSQLPKNLAVAVLSDEPECAEDYIGRKADILGTGRDHNLDFAMIFQCRYIVAANSTFSWWAAWLAGSSNRSVIAPKYFLGWQRREWFPADIMVPGWEYI